MPSAQRCYMESAEALRGLSSELKLLERARVLARVTVALMNQNPAQIARG